MFSNSNTQSSTSLLPWRWVYHAFFWISYTSFWHIVAANHPFTLYSCLISVLFMAIDIGAAYTNIYYLMPKYFYTKSYGKYAVLFFANIIGFILLMMLLWSGLEQLFFETSNVLTSKYAFSSVFGSVMGVVSITMLIKLGKRSLETEKKNELLEKEKLASELKFLKSQLNPHFLFNALNSIYFMIKKDQDSAAEALANFSDMLRYQIYDCNDAKISLKKEIEFLENFIRLSKLRKNDDFKLKTSFDQNINGEMVAPLVLIPFVENAFKHVSSGAAQDNWIDIELKLKGSQLLFEVSNSLGEEEKSEEAVKVGGIGLPNVKRRLDLLYEEQYDLKIEETDQEYKIALKIDLD